MIVESDPSVLAQSRPDIAGPAAPGAVVAAGVAQDCLALGQLLKSARERSGVTLEDLVAETKIPLRHLEALELGNFAAVPAGIYARAEIRAYADGVQLDPRIALTRFDTIFPKAAPPRLEGPRKPLETLESVERPSGPFRKVIAMGALAATIVVALAIATRPSQSRRTPEERPAPPQRLAEVQALTSAPAAAPSAGLQTALPVSGTVGETETAEESNEGQLVVMTDPVGGRVTINDIGWGVTPITIRHLPLGVKRIRVTKDGYRAAERVVQLAPDQPNLRVGIRLPAAQ